jgi:hypothetical protein
MNKNQSESEYQQYPRFFKQMYLSQINDGERSAEIASLEIIKSNLSFFVGKTTRESCKVDKAAEKIVASGKSQQHWQQRFFVFLYSLGACK